MLVIIVILVHNFFSWFFLSARCPDLDRCFAADPQKQPAAGVRGARGARNMQVPENEHGLLYLGWNQDHGACPADARKNETERKEERKRMMMNNKEARKETKRTK